MSKKLFVYGTLTRNTKINSELMHADSLRYLGRGEIEGKLYDLDEYPGALEEKGARIHGEIFEILDTKVLDIIDKYEEFDSKHPRESLYIRKITTAISKEGKKIPVYAYFYNGEIQGAKLIPSGKWQDRK